jgi:hypothetical protein
LKKNDVNFLLTWNSGIIHLSKYQKGHCMHASKFNLSSGVWICIAGIILGLAYFAAMLATGLSPSGFPPVAPYDGIISIISLLSAVAILMLFAVLHMCAPEERKLFSLSALAFATLFAGLTTINRFTHLAIVRPGLYVGLTDGIEWFTPYGAYSIMTGLENLAWGFFFGLAYLTIAPVFTGPGIKRLLSWTLLANGILCLISVFALPLGIPWLTYVGAMAWGPGFILVCVLLIIMFKRELSK